MEAEDLAARPGSGSQIDPRFNPGIVRTRFGRDEAEWGLQLRLRFWPRTTLVLGHLWRWTQYREPYRDDGDPSITDIYDPEGLVGWNTGLLDARTGVGVEFDNLRRHSRYVPKFMASAGWRVQLFAGGVEGVAGSPTRYGIAGADIQRFFDLFHGDRVLALRFRSEYIMGDRKRIPFSDYPSLGGPSLLRGYPRWRFRDRLSTLLSAEYRYPVGEEISGYLFVDVGRVWPSLQFRPEMPRVGYGGGIILHYRSAFLGRLQLAGSSDLTFTAALVFNPSFDLEDPI
jgi:hypothetical protein